MGSCYGLPDGLPGVELNHDRLLVHFHRRKGLMVWYGVGFA